MGLVTCLFQVRSTIRFRMVSLTIRISLPLDRGVRHLLARAKDNGSIPGWSLPDSTFPFFFVILLHGSYATLFFWAAAHSLLALYLYFS